MRRPANCDNERRNSGNVVCFDPLRRHNTHDAHEQNNEEDSRHTHHELHAVYLTSTPLLSPKTALRGAEIGDSSVAAAVVLIDEMLRVDRQQQISR